MKLRGSKGFTLMELIVVIALIGVLAGIATPSIFSYITSSQQRADQSSAKQIQSAVSLMFALDSSNTYVDNVTGGVFWGYDKKTKIREYIHDKLGTGSYEGTPTGAPSDVTVGDEEKYLIPRPKENSHAFYMYLLPPYTVVSLQTKNTSAGQELYQKGDIDTSVVNAEYLKERYPQINYAQVGTTVNLDAASATWGTATIATVGKEGTENCVGWLNRGIDYGQPSIADSTTTSHKSDNTGHN